MGYRVLLFLLYSLAHRIDRMQSAIIPLSVNLDKVMEKLNGTSKDKKIRRKDMENIFDDIVQGQSGNKNIVSLFIPVNSDSSFYS